MSQHPTSSIIPFSKACEYNKQPILNILETLLTEPITVVEIGSGTGQHGEYFSEQLPHIYWQPTDLECNIGGLENRRAQVSRQNLMQSMVLNVIEDEWPIGTPDAFFSANTTHIMSWSEVKCFLRGVGKHLKPEGVFCLYGPFNYNGSFSSESNAMFDRHLKERSPKSGIRDIEAIQEQAQISQLNFIADHPMPANNRLLVWRKRS